MKLFIFLSVFSSVAYVIVSMKIPEKITKQQFTRQKTKPLTSSKKQFIDAVIYESKDKQNGQSISYKQSSTAFYDLRPIVDSFEDKQISMICVLGSWLLYNQAELAAAAIGEVRLLSAEDKCVPPGITLGSIQPIGPLSPVYTDSITFFKKENFAGEGVAVKESTKSHKLKLSVSEVDSLIVTGRSKWTLIVDFSQFICVSIKTNKLAPICFVPYLEDKPFTRVFEVRKGCDSDDKTKYNGYLILEDCSNFGSGIIENIDLKRPPSITHTSIGFMKPEGRGIGDYLLQKTALDHQTQTRRLGRGIDAGGDGCKKPLDDSGPEASEGERRCTEMLDIRMNQAVEILEKDENMMLPTDMGKVWRVELLDHVVSVALATCPFEVVVPEYIKLVRELFLYHVNEKWEKDQREGDPVDPEMWQKVVSQTQMCAATTKMHGEKFQEDVMLTYTLARSPGDYSIADMPVLKLDRQRDTIIEFMWLLANHVAATCHQASGFVDDYLESFTMLFHQMYLIPLEELWKKPGNTLMRCYNHVLGGYDMDSQYQRMRLCTEKSLSLTNNLEPWDRDWVSREAWARK